MKRILVTLLACGLAPALAHADAAKFYVVVAGVDEAAGVQSGITPQLKELFTTELKKHAEITLEPPAGLPSDPEEMKAELKKHKLKAYEMRIKVLGVTREVKPPKDGKQYRILVRGIKLSVLGDTLPEKLLAVGGDGEAEAGSEVGAHADLDQEGKALLVDVSKEAVKQAVDQTVNKLNLSGKTVKVPSKKKK